eukprot:TRINITY_DN25134_c0_g1_i1.p1 TRINITY_DN25134_c0_g1~~TRINITY_DN25134_c0_g1_i1.p1  ORF type:complete len:125 (-),score=23.52 TRINITY_DN25134_c0_g1_i1:33-407(-)
MMFQDGSDEDDIEIIRGEDVVRTLHNRESTEEDKDDKNLSRLSVEVKLTKKRFSNRYSKMLTNEVVVNKLIDHCLELTTNMRVWMESHPNEPLPERSKEFPGKCDQATVLALRVGDTSNTTLHN